MSTHPPQHCSLGHASPQMMDPAKDGTASRRPPPSPPSTSPPPSNSTPSFRQHLIALHGTPTANLAKTTSILIQKMASYSCHISFLKACRDHHFTPKGLRLPDPVKTNRSSNILNKASTLLLTERLNYYRHHFSITKNNYDLTLRRLETDLNPSTLSKLQHLNVQKSSFTHKQYLTTHKKKFQSLIDEYKAPFSSPYDKVDGTSFPIPTLRGPLPHTTPTNKSTSLKAVVNLSSTDLSPEELEVLNLGLKFVPTPTQDPTPDLAPRIQNTLKRLPEGMESSATHQIVEALSSYNPKTDKTPDNMTHQQRAALKSLKSKKKHLKFLPADKGNATVVLSSQQYLDKVNDHIQSSGCYSKLKKDPTTSVHDKLYRILLKMKKEGKIDHTTMQEMRQLHPQWPQLYGQPKIHKPGAPIRPVVAFCNTPLSALHKVLARILKPLSRNPLRLKDSHDFKQHLSNTGLPSFPYHVSLDIKSLYTSCDMTKALETAIKQFTDRPDLLPSNFTTSTLHSLVTFCLDNSYFEFNGDFYSQDSGGTMGSPLVVELAEIRVAEVEDTALKTCSDPPNTYRHFVDDGIGDFRDSDHADSFQNHLNSLTDDLTYTIEHPSSDGTLPFMDVLIHPDKSTSVYRKPTHTNLYTRYNSSAPSSAKYSVIRSLTRRAYNICSPQHLQAELDTVYSTCLQNGYPSHTVNSVMDKVKQKLNNPNRMSARQFNRQLETTAPSLKTSLPYHPSLTKPIKKILSSHDIKVTDSSGTNLRDLLTKTKTTPPPHLTPNVIYEISCNDCTATYNGQTYRPVHKRLSEHERDSRNPTIPDGPTDFATNKSAPAHHSRTTGHTIGWTNTTILTQTRTRSQLDLTEHAAIQMRQPSLNRTDGAPLCNNLWDPLLPKISKSFKPRHAGISS